MSIPVFELIVRWVHLLAVIIAVGGSFFTRFVLIPASASLPDTARVEFHRALLARWRPFFHGSMGLLLISGLVRIFQVMPNHQGQPLFHAILGTKILLALILFVIAGCLVSRNPAFDPMRKSQAKWLALILTLAVLVIGLAGVLHLMPDSHKSIATPNESQVARMRSPIRADLPLTDNRSDPLFATAPTAGLL